MQLLKSLKNQSSSADLIVYESIPTIRSIWELVGCGYVEIDNEKWIIKITDIGRKALSEYESNTELS